MARYVSKHAKKRSSIKSKKPVVAATAVVLALAAIFGGTFAWQSISQEALNEVSATVNPGGRLHDDFNDVTEETNEDHLVYDKDVYVENFTTVLDNGVQIYARVRLDEYMEIGKNAGALGENGEKAEDNEAVSLWSGSKLDDKSTWRTNRFTYDEDNPFEEYWTWTQDGGSTVYMPTFNKNKDSLEADINGTFDAQFTDHVDYVVNESAYNYYSIYDVDDDTEDELTDNNVDIANVIKNGPGENLPEIYKDIVEFKQESHIAKATLTAGKMLTMDEYINRLNDDVPANDTGSFWVVDEDGWAYWAAPIDPNTATGLLLDGIERTDVIINQDWYYGINVVAQFITGDDIGKPENEGDLGSGFYDAAEGAPPSDNALLLLNRIGVDVTFEVETAEELEKALKYGGTIKLADENGEISIEKQLEVCADTVLDLGDNNVLKPSNAIWDEESENESWSILSVRNGATLTINGGNYTAIEDDSFCVDVRDGSKVIINGGTFKGNISAVYVLEGEAIINGGTYSIMQTSSTGGAYNYVLNCYDDNFTKDIASIKVYGGEFHDFDPSAPVEVGNVGYVPVGYASKETTAEGAATRVFVVGRDDNGASEVTTVEE